MTHTTQHTQLETELLEALERIIRYAVLDTVATKDDLTFVVQTITKAKGGA